MNPKPKWKYYPPSEERRQKMRAEAAAKRKRDLAQREHVQRAVKEGAKVRDLDK